MSFGPAWGGTEYSDEPLIGNSVSPTVVRRMHEKRHSVRELVDMIVEMYNDPSQRADFYEFMWEFRKLLSFK